MKLLSVLVLIQFFYCWSALGQQFSFAVETTGFDATETVYLKKYHGIDEIAVDSIKGSGKHQFHVSTEYGVEGLYLISTRSHETAELILNPSEKQLQVRVEKDRLRTGGITVLNSKENEAYAQFVEAYLAYEPEFYKLAYQRSDEFDPKFISQVIHRSQAMEQIQSELNARLDRLASTYPNTFTANMLCPLAQLPIRTEEQRTEFETYLSFLNRHFWSNTDLGHEHLLNHFLFNEMLKNYFRFFVPKHEVGMKEAIDRLHAASEHYPEVNGHIRSFLLRNFLNSNADALSSYVNQLSDGTSCELNLTEEQLQKLSALQTVVDSGSTVPMVSLPDQDQQYVSLNEVCFRSKLTLVLFWSANCPHCMNEIPELVKVYEQFNPFGLELYAINLDENKFDFRDHLANSPTPWINVTDTDPVHRSEVVRAFNIRKTPSLFLVNTDGTVIGKNLFGESLIRFLNTYFEAK